MDSTVLFDLSYGVYVVSAYDGKRPSGCVVNTVAQVTATPATVAVSVNHDNYTNGLIAATGVFGISVLTQDCDPGLIGRFGFLSGRDTDKFEGPTYIDMCGAPVLTGESGCFTCKVLKTMETETHTVFLGEVVDGMRASPPKLPMTYAYYHNVVKGKSPKNAPTYRATEEPKSGGVWVCSVCGYEYRGDALPENFTCPVCGRDSEFFRKKTE